MHSTLDSKIWMCKLKTLLGEYDCNSSVEQKYINICSVFDFLSSDLIWMKSYKKLVRGSEKKLSQLISDPVAQTKLTELEMDKLYRYQEIFGFKKYCQSYTKENIRRCRNTSVKRKEYCSFHAKKQKKIVNKLSRVDRTYLGNDIFNIISKYAV